MPFQIAEDGLSAPTLASGVGSAQAGAGSAGEAKPAEPETLIIRRGDNLWMIAKRLYGKGIRYSTIYQANTDQIRNPDLIYPGQVFVILEGDLPGGPSVSNIPAIACSHHGTRWKKRLSQYGKPPGRVRVGRLFKQCFSGGP